MTEWWTYRLSDFLLFAPDTYRRLFELAHAQGWPWAQAAAAALGLGVGLCAARAPAQPRAAALACLLLGAAWAGAALFLGRHYATINWGAPALAAAFWLQAALLAARGVTGLATRQPGPPPRPPTVRARRTGGWLIGAAVAGYPWLAPLQGQPWAQAELFALMPDPTVLATLGLWPLLRVGAPPQGGAERAAALLWWLAWPIPLAAALVAGATLWAMGSPMAPLLPAAAVLACWAARR